MDTPSSFTFVETGLPTSRRGTSRGSTARSLIRSHAMQQVWEQRRLQRAHLQGESNFEIVLENEQLKGSKKAKLKSSRNTTDPPLGTAGARKSKKDAARKLSHPDSETTAVPSTNSKSAARFVAKSRGAASDAHKRLRRNPLGGLQPKQSAGFDGGSSQASWDSNPATSPSTIDMCLMDPFNTCSISLGPTESRYLNHYFQALSWRFTMPKKTWLRYAIHDPGLLHGVLAIAAAHYSFATTRGLSNDALYHHGKTINHVQKCLLDPMLRFSDGVIGSIGRMVICHLIFGNRGHFVTHMEALERSTVARGGLETLGMVGQLRYIIASCVAGAATIWWDDVPPQLRHPYGALDYPAVHDVQDAGSHDPEWGSAFQELNKVGFLSDTLLDICQAIVAINSIITSRRVWDEPQQRAFGDQCNKISLRLAYLKEAEAKHSDDMTPVDHVKECVRSAVHLYLIAFQRDVPLLSNLCIQTLHRLRDSLSRTDLETSWGGGQLGQVLLWVLIITASGCVRPQERECAGLQLRKTASQLGVTQWQDVKRICRRFLFLESALEWKTWPLWKDYGAHLGEEMSPVRPKVCAPPPDKKVVVVH